ncbi:MAG: response regulator transcription factor [Clostridia bacterium]|nr:response regulator transcription factor [Clostridia bacterium]
MKPIKILIADAQSILREGLKSILDYEEDMKVVATAENGVQVYDRTVTFSPNVILIDIMVLQMNGLETIHAIKRDYPNTVILVLTNNDEEENIINALYLGATGYLLKDISRSRLIQAIREAATGDFILPSNIALKLAGKLFRLSEGERKQEQLSMLGLSDREKEIAYMVAEGYTNRQIASSLYISNGTVKNYISAIYSKVGTSDRLKAASYLKEFVV